MISNDHLDMIDSVVGAANHSPDLSDQIMIVAAMEKVLGVIDAKRSSTHAHEHTMASGLMRSALKYERQLLHGMARRNELIGKALNEGTPHAHAQLP